VSGAVELSIYLVSPAPMVVNANTDGLNNTGAKTSVLSIRLGRPSTGKIVIVISRTFKSTSSWLTSETAQIKVRRLERFEGNICKNFPVIR
jgi:hypothetical protein